MSGRSDVVVVGAGIGGLGVGALLARAGMHVTVLEGAKDIGGRAYSYRRRGHVTNVGGPRAGLEGDRADGTRSRPGPCPVSSVRPTPPSCAQKASWR